MSGGHTTLENRTGIDIFCSAHLVLPSTGQLLVAGGDTWSGISTTNTGNLSTGIFSNGVLMRAGDMHRPRWCPSATALGNGEIYLQGGAGGRDRPEVREQDGSIRLLSGADTSSHEAVGPRNFLAPDGRVFGFDANGVMYYVDPSGTGRRSLVGQLRRDFAGRSSSAAMFR